MTVKYTSIVHCKDTPAFTQTGIFGLEICHLATLLAVRACSEGFK
jgi:hypothetical protein